MNKENYKSHIINSKLQLGFTLIEILIAISIFLIIGTFSANFYTGFLTQNAVLNTQDQLLSSFRKAQMYAMIGKKASNWGVFYDSYPTKKIILYRGIQWASHNPDSDEEFTINSNVSIGTGGDIDWNFTRPSGMPNRTGAVAISDGKTTKYISINSQGVATR